MSKISFGGHVWADWGDDPLALQRNLPWLGGLRSTLLGGIDAHVTVGLVTKYDLN